MSGYYQRPATTWSDDEIRDYYDTTTVTLNDLARMTGKGILKLKEILLK